MRLLLDLHSTNKTKTGVARYWMNLKNYLEKEFPKTKIYCSYSSNAYFRLFLGFHRAIKNYRPDILHTDTFAPINANIPVVITVHDLIFKDAFQFLPFRRRVAFDLFFKHSVFRADAIICNSLSTRKRLMCHFPRLNSEKIFVTYFASDPVFKPLNKDKVKKELKSKFNISSDYFLIVGNIEKRKNLIPVLEAHTKLSKKHKIDLVMAGSVSNEAIVKDSLEFNKAIYLGYVSDDVLNLLYNGARGVIFYSRYEGFGFPLVEAMACKSPIICSDLEVFHEIAGEAAVYAENKTSLISLMEKLILDDNFFNDLSRASYNRRKKFSWLKTARETYEIYKWVLKN